MNRTRMVVITALAVFGLGGLGLAGCGQDSNEGMNEQTSSAAESSQDTGMAQEASTAENGAEDMGAAAEEGGDDMDSDESMQESLDAMQEDMQESATEKMQQDNMGMDGQDEEEDAAQ